MLSARGYLWIGNNHFEENTIAGSFDDIGESSICSNTMCAKVKGLVKGHRGFHPHVVSVLPLRLPSGYEQESEEYRTEPDGHDGEDRTIVIRFQQTLRIDLVLNLKSC